MSKTNGDNEPITSFSVISKFSNDRSVKSIKLLWFNTTPLGVPVEPEVFIIQYGSVSIIFELIEFKTSSLILQLKSNSSKLIIFISAIFSILDLYLEVVITNFG